MTTTAFSLLESRSLINVCPLTDLFVHDSWFSDLIPSQVFVQVTVQVAVTTTAFILLESRLSLTTTASTFCLESQSQINVYGQIHVSPLSD